MRGDEALRAKSGYTRPMLMAAVALMLWAGAQDPQSPGPVVLNAGLGGCSADFSVTGADGQPAYAAVIRTNVRYGFMSMKRMELELSSGPDGKARIQGLPAKGKPLAYTIIKGPEKASATQALKTQCNATFTVALK
jgi:hypothetical protein